MISYILVDIDIFAFFVLYGNNLAFFIFSEYIFLGILFYGAAISGCLNHLGCFGNRTRV